MRKDRQPRQVTGTPVRHRRTARRSLEKGTCFARWLRRLLRTDGVAHREVREEIQLDLLKQRMRCVLAPFMLRMSRRDMQLYLRVLAAEQRDALRELRFEYFDLLCRMLCESEAMAHLREIDAMLDG